MLPPAKMPFWAPRAPVTAELTLSLANRPVARAPHMPPQAWTPNTSSASSYLLSLLLSWMALKQIGETTRPMIRAAKALTNPQAGVMATRPATAPEARPTAVGFLNLIHSTSIHDRAAAAVAMWVLMNAAVATPSAASSLPALKPNQPNQSRAAPRSTIGDVVRAHPRRCRGPCACRA